MKMLNARISKVENGWIVQVTKIDILEGRQPIEEAYIFGLLDDALDFIRKESGERITAKLTAV